MSAWVFAGGNHREKFSIVIVSFLALVACGGRDFDQIDAASTPVRVPGSSTTGLPAGSVEDLKALRSEDYVLTSGPETKGPTIATAGVAQGYQDASDLALPEPCAPMATGSRSEKCRFARHSVSRRTGVRISRIR